MANPYSYNTITLLLPYIHGAYNLTIFLFLLYQARIGFTIRMERLRGIPPPFQSIKRHRKLGPFLVVGGIFGFLAGLLMVYLEDGHVAGHPVHFAIGLLIAFLLILTFVVARKIRIHETQSRIFHLLSGYAYSSSIVVQTSSILLNAESMVKLLFLYR